MSDGIEIPFTKNYMIDRSGNVYAYIEALDAAVESEMLIACSTDSRKIPFYLSRASSKNTVFYEEASRCLTAAHT